MAAVDKQMRIEFQKQVEELQNNQKEIKKCVELRQKLEAQLIENKVVKQELEILESGSNIYKLTGPVLVKQDLDEARSTVTKRIDYIVTEVKRQEKSIKEFEAKQEKHRDSLTKLQSRLPAPK